MPGASVSTKPRKEMKTPSSTHRRFRFQRLGGAHWRSLWVRNESRRVWLICEFRDASSTKVLPAQEMRVKATWLFLVTIFFFLLREYCVKIQSCCMHVYVLYTCPTLAITLCPEFGSVSEASCCYNQQDFVVFSAMSSKPLSISSYLWRMGSDRRFRGYEVWDNMRGSPRHRTEAHPASPISSSSFPVTPCMSVFGVYVNSLQGKIVNLSWQDGISGAGL